MLLTNKKPEKIQPPQQQGTTLAMLPARARKIMDDKSVEGEAEALRPREPGEDETLWQLGEDSDEEDGRGNAMHAQEEGVPRPRRRDSQKGTEDAESSHRSGGKGERAGLMHRDDGEDDDEVSGSSGSTRVAREDEYGEWQDPDRTR